MMDVTDDTFDRVTLIEPNSKNRWDIDDFIGPHDFKEIACGVYLEDLEDLLEDQGDMFPEDFIDWNIVVTDYQETFGGTVDSVEDRNDGIVFYFS